MKHDESQALPEHELVSCIGGAVTSAVPSDEAFRAAVLQKLSERNETLVEPGTSGASVSLPGFGWLRVAASLLPAGFAPAAFAGSSALKGPVAKGIFGKLLGAALVPVFVAAVAVMSFTTSLNRTVDLKGDRTRLRSEDLGRQELVSWIKVHWLATVGAVLLFVLLGYVSPLDAGVFAIAVSMLSTAMVARRLSDQGMCDRRMLRGHIVTVMWQLMVLLGVLAHLTNHDASPRNGLLELTGYMLAGATAVAISSLDPRRWFRRGEPVEKDPPFKDAVFSTLPAVVLAALWLILFGLRGGSGAALDQLVAGELPFLDLRLPVAGVLHVVFSAVIMKRAPRPRPRGRRAPRPQSD